MPWFSGTPTGSSTRWRMGCSTSTRGVSRADGSQGVCAAWGSWRSGMGSAAGSSALEGDEGGRGIPPHGRGSTSTARVDGEGRTWIQDARHERDPLAGEADRLNRLDVWRAAEGL
ncbi:hypothetical protein TRIP_B330621 [uncultured Desulfatiglans sp.]|nr:hypothetical protein TRIP_B330621 [uncultured Desulfatiglans sp.]